MTILNYQQLIASFPDNNDGDIQPFNFRDLVDSVERKYANWNVVASGDIEGAKFPDADEDGYIHLPDDSVWIINGEVTVVAQGLMLGKNVSIIGLSGDFNKDQLVLDASIVGGALINDVPDAINTTIRGVGLFCFSASSSVFDIDSSDNVFLSDIAILAQSAGSIAGFGNLIADFIVCLAFEDTLNITGSDSVVEINRLNDQSGIPTSSDIVRLDGTFNQIRLTSCSKNADNAFDLFDWQGTTNRGIVSSCTVVFGMGGSIIPAALITDTAWTYTGNSGIRNTNIGGGVLMADNTAVTLNAGSGVYAPANGTGTLSSTAQRVIRPTRCQLQYIGESAFNANVTISGCVALASGGGSISADIAVMKNGVLFSDGGVVAKIGITLTNSATPFALTVPIELEEDDTVDVAIAVNTASRDTVVSCLQITLG